MTLFRRKIIDNWDKVIDKDRIPVHIAVIPDGNGRWAAKRGMPRSYGHREGSYTLRRTVMFCSKIGVKYLTVYTFSTENWKRPQDEVDALMALLLEFLKNAEKELQGSNVRIRVFGDINKLSEEFQNEIHRVVKVTESNSGLSLNIALNYGGRYEILNAVKELAREACQGKINPDNIDEELFSQRLYTSGIPDPEMIIRTSGEKRSSNYLIWQAAYSEYWYTDTLWPDFKEEDMIEAIKTFQKRNRRFGGA